MDESNVFSILIVVWPRGLGQGGEFGGSDSGCMSAPHLL